MNCVEYIEFEANNLIEKFINEIGYLDPMLIVINSNLSEEEFKFTLFHELGHYFLGHKDRLLLNSSFTMNLKEEYHADLFATYMYLNYRNLSYLYDEVLLPKRVFELKEKFF